MNSELYLIITRVVALIMLVITQLFIVLMWRPLGYQGHQVLFFFTLASNALMILGFYKYIAGIIKTRLIAEALNELMDNGLTVDRMVPHRSGKRSPIVQTFNKFVDLVLVKAKTINNETTRFNVYASDFSSLAKRLTAIALSSSVALDKTRSQMKQMDTNAEETAKNLQSLQVSSKEEQDAVQQMYGVIQRVEQVLENLMQQTNDNYLNIMKGRQQIAVLATSISNMSAKINAIALVMKKFKGSTQQIQSVLEVINEIAERTHLLATNAAIESARVGGIGKGFSVVATEIRMLADSSSQSIEDVESTIDDSFVSLRDAFDAVREGSRIVDSFTRTANDIASLFEQFETVSGNIQDGIKRATTFTQKLGESGSLVEKSSMAIKHLGLSFEDVFETQLQAYKKIILELDYIISETKGSNKWFSEMSDLSEFVTNSSNSLQNTMKIFVVPDDNMGSEYRTEKRSLSAYKLELLEDTTELPVGYLLDCSQKGLGFISEQPFPVGHTVKLRLVFPGNLKREFNTDMVSFEVVVRRIVEQDAISNTSGGGAIKYQWFYGCEFINISDKNQRVMDALNNFMQSIDIKAEFSTEPEGLLIEERPTDIIPTELKRPEASASQMPMTGDSIVDDVIGITDDIATEIENPTKEEEEKS